MVEVIISFPERKPGDPDPMYVVPNVVQKLVRCKDCKHYNTRMKCCDWMDIYPWPDPEWFCAEGAMKE